jgi:zinc/manganese transport system substrate-binding protein
MKKLLLSVFISAVVVAAPVKVVTSTTDLAWAAKEIGGDLIEVQAFLKGTENPHYIDAIPEFIRLSAEAQVVCVVGLDLEIGWMPKVVARSGNAQVQPGGKGYCETGKGISVLEKPAGNVDRSMGDIHPAGNPHFWMSPDYFAQGAAIIKETLIGVDPAHVAEYQAGYAKFKTAVEAIRKRNVDKLQAVLPKTTGPLLIEYHKEFAYYLETYGMKSMGSVEEKPGVTPSAGRIAEVAMSAKNAGIRFVLAAETAPKATLQRFTEISGIPVIQVPMSIQPKNNLKDYGSFQDHITDSIIKVLSNKAT